MDEVPVSLTIEGADCISNSPLVILFGWSGCQDKYLSKYSTIWRKLGCVTARYTLPLSMMVWSRQCDKIGQQLFQYIIVENNWQNRCVVFHLFSGGGCRPYVSFMQAWIDQIGQQSVKSLVIGLVMDSCPAHTSAWNTATAFTLSVLPQSPSWIQTILCYTSWIAFFTVAIAKVLLQLCGFRSRGEHYYPKMCEANFLPKHQLYLYSKMDSICDWTSIETFQSIQKRKGAEVTSILWTDSAHVDHYRSHKVEYELAINRFLNKVSNF